MSLKESFTPEEWARVIGAPMLAEIAVTAAAPGGIWGAVKESAAVAGALGTAKASVGGNPLIGEIVAAYETSAGRDMARGVLKAEAKGKPPGRGGGGRGRGADRGASPSLPRRRTARARSRTG